MKSRVIAGALIVFASLSQAAEVIPKKPDRYFNDYARVASPATADRLNHQLAEFERETSNQFLVVVYPQMQSDSDIADYVRRFVSTWNVGQKGNRNGVVLAVFVKDHKMTIQTNYGLEGALPDAICIDIINDIIRPKFKAGDYEGGLAAGINAIIAATRGEYKGSGKTFADKRGNAGVPSFLLFVIFVIVLIVISRASRRRGYHYSGFGGPLVGGWSSGSSGGWSGGDSFVGGGGGSFGGGGASGSW
jgi:uncharacterized protein